MKRLALALALILAAPAASGDESPPWMPRPAGLPLRSSQQRARALLREAKIFGAVGISLFGVGIAVNVVALDLAQGNRMVRQVDGTVVNQPVRDDANWLELAVGIALAGTGIALAAIGLFKAKQARRLASE